MGSKPQLPRKVTGTVPSCRLISSPPGRRADQEIEFKFKENRFCFLHQRPSSNVAMSRRAWQAVWGTIARRSKPNARHVTSLTDASVYLQTRPWHPLPCWHPLPECAVLFPYSGDQLGSHWGSSSNAQSVGPESQAPGAGPERGRKGAAVGPPRPKRIGLPFLFPSPARFGGSGCVQERNGVFQAPRRLVFIK